MKTIRKNYYLSDRVINLSKNSTFKVVEGTIEVQLLVNGYPIVRQFLVPFDKVYHLLNTEFTSVVMKKEKDWMNGVYIFYSFTIRDNILLNSLDYSISPNFKEGVGDINYEELFSFRYNLGRDMVLKMYRGLNDLIKNYKIPVRKIAYSKIHRLTNKYDSVNIVDYSKFRKLLERV